MESGSFEVAICLFGELFYHIFGIFLSLVNSGTDLSLFDGMCIFDVLWVNSFFGVLFDNLFSIVSMNSFTLSFFFFSFYSCCGIMMKAMSSILGWWWMGIGVLLGGSAHDVWPWYFIEYWFHLYLVFGSCSYIIGMLIPHWCSLFVCAWCSLFGWIVSMFWPFCSFFWSSFVSLVVCSLYELILPVFVLSVGFYFCLDFIVPALGLDADSLLFLQ